MFNQEDNEEVPENFLDSKTMLSYYFKTFELFNKQDSENMAVEDSKLCQEMEKKCNISEKHIRSMRKEVDKWNIQVEAVVKEEEAAKLEIAEQERAVTTFQNDMKKLQNFVQQQNTRGQY
jgi:seryl-tRNA(Sec) selenium transferase